MPHSWMKMGQRMDKIRVKSCIQKCCLREPSIRHQCWWSVELRVRSLQGHIQRNWFGTWPTSSALVSGWTTTEPWASGAQSQCWPSGQSQEWMRQPSCSGQAHTPCLGSWRTRGLVWNSQSTSQTATGLPSHPTLCQNSYRREKALLPAGDVPTRSPYSQRRPFLPLNTACRWSL